MIKKQNRPLDHTMCIQIRNVWSGFGNDTSDGFVVQIIAAHAGHIEIADRTPARAFNSLARSTMGARRLWRLVGCVVGAALLGTVQMLLLGPAAVRSAEDRSAMTAAAANRPVRRSPAATVITKTNPISGIRANPG